MNLGIRLHDTAPGTLEERLDFARAQGFTCAHLALSKALDGFAMNEAPRLMDDELAARVRSAFGERGMDCAVLGCYLKLATDDGEALERTREIYRAHLEATRDYAADHPNVILEPDPAPAFRNLSYSVVGERLVIVSKNKSPAIHFVIHHPKMVQAFLGFQPPIREPDEP